MLRQSYSAASFVERGYGQVEPNHLSAQRTGQIYAQLPAAPEIEKLENGQFVKYDYANEMVNFTGPGEWMLVFNEVKVYREGQSDCDFAMLKDNYNARVYSPIDGTTSQTLTSARNYSGTGNVYDSTSATFTTGTIPKVATSPDPYEWDSTDTPFASEWDYNGPKLMPSTTANGATKMVPRVFKTNVGDIMTTNMLMSSTSGVPSYPAIGSTFTPGATGILEVTSATSGMLWQVVKQYDLGDRQKAVKLMRIA